jgi:hypothetical protein
MTTVKENYYETVFNELNEMNSLRTQGYFGHRAKTLQNPEQVVSDSNLLAVQHTKIGFATMTEEDKQRVVEYFLHLGNHLAEHQGAIYVDMTTDHYGVEKVVISFPRFG